LKRLHGLKRGWAGIEGRGSARPIGRIGGGSLGSSPDHTADRCFGPIHSFDVPSFPSLDGIASFEAGMAYSSVLTLRRSPQVMIDAAFYQTMESTWILNCRH
jgi:hypothetical protein